MNTFDWSTNQQTPDYRPILEILKQRMQLPNPTANGINSLMGGLQQGMGIGQQLRERQQRKQWQDTVNSLASDPTASPVLKQIAPLIAQQPELAGQIIPSLMKQQFGSSAVTTVYRDPQTGEMSDQPREGWVPYSTTQDRALMRLSSQTAQKQRTNTLKDLVGVRREGIQARQRDVLAKTTNLPLQQLKTLTQNNIRADRALEVAGSPNVTWQRLGFALTDLAAMMQGGVPHVDQLKQSMFPSWKENIANWRTYVTGSPTANVPEPIRQEVMKMVQEVKNVDNQYLQQSQETQTGIIGPTIDDFNTKVKPIIDRGTQNFMRGGTSQPNTGVKTFSTVQEAEAANLPKGTRIRIGDRMATVQ